MNLPQEHYVHYVAWLAIIWWRLSPSSTSPGIAQTTVEGLAVNWCHKSVEGRLAIGYGGQFHFSGIPHNPTSRFWSSPTSVVTTESFSDRPGPL